MAIISQWLRAMSKGQKAKSEKPRAKCKEYQANKKEQKTKAKILYMLCSNPPFPPFSKGGMGGLLVYALCSLLFASGFVLFFCTPVFAEGPSGWANLNYISTEQFEDDERISKEGSYYRNLYLTFEKPITPLISYQLYLRTNWTDFRLPDAEARITKTYQRAIEPALDIFLRNPMYDFSAGYRRLEQWTP